MYSRRILLVEDDPNDYELLFQAMERTGLAYQIDLASSLSEALDKLFRLDNNHLRHRHSLPALILVDINMSGLCGLQLLRMLHNIHDPHGAPLPPIVIFSASDTPLDIREAYRLGVCSFVRKPLHTGRFLEVVQQIMLYWLTINEAPSEPHSDPLFHLVSQAEE